MWYLLFCLHVRAAYCRAISRTSLLICVSRYTNFIFFLFYSFYSLYYFLFSMGLVVSPQPKTAGPRGHLLSVIQFDLKWPNVALLYIYGKEGFSGGRLASASNSLPRQNCLEPIPGFFFYSFSFYSFYWYVFWCILILFSFFFIHFILYTIFYFLWVLWSDSTDYSSNDRWNQPVPMCQWCWCRRWSRSQYLGTEDRSGRRSRQVSSQCEWWLTWHSARTEHDHLSHNNDH